VSEMDSANIKKGIGLLLVFLVLPLGLAIADQKDFLFQQGNEFYKAGDYEKAARAYEQILQMGYESAAIYYNLGNAYFKLHQNSRAILNYERALRLAPNDEDIRHNLQLANLAVVDKIPSLPELFYIRAFRQFRDRFTLSTLFILVICLYLICIGTLIIRILTKRNRARQLALFVITVCGIPLLFFSGILISKIHHLHCHVEAIIMTEKVDARSAPSSDGTELFVLHEGVKVHIVNRTGEWVEIKLADGKKGWLPKEVLEVI